MSRFAWTIETIKSGCNIHKNQARFLHVLVEFQHLYTRSHSSFQNFLSFQLFQDQNEFQIVAKVMSLMFKILTTLAWE